MKRILSGLFAALICVGVNAGDREKYDAEGAGRIAGMSVMDGVEVELFADSSQIQNPTSLFFDSKDRMLVCEINRWRKGVDDIRHRRFMLFEDIAIQTNEDRLKMYKKYEDKYPLSYYSKESSIIKAVEDTDGDGRADKSYVYAEGFTDPLDGPGIGVIERDNIVYYANIPHLWKLEDTDGDGVSDKRESLQDGFGTRMSFSGHDMHGLVWGPDGKLYWSMGDRGFSVKTKEGKTFHGPNEGGVFRCDPDGSNVEQFYWRLRNPQELAFDDFGNLFTADNDGDLSDTERISYIVEGGDSGWHAGHQVLMHFQSDYALRPFKHTGTRMLNIWEHTMMSKPRHPDQPGYLLPGIKRLGGGPSGFTFNPSDSMGEKYDNKFFVNIYQGLPIYSRVEMFNIHPDGAGFIGTKSEKLIGGLQGVDVEFGNDGGLYVSEYNYGGWTNQNVGNVYRLSIPGEIDKPSVKEDHKTLKSDFSKKSVKELAELLGRNHQKVRYRAQFELAKRSKDGSGAFMEAAARGPNLFTRVHGVWGLGMMARQYPKANILKTSVAPLANDKEDQVRIQVMRVLGDQKYNEGDVLLKGLKDKHPQAAMYAGIGIGRVGYEPAVPELIRVIRENDGEDLFLQHGMIMGLKGIKPEAWLKYAKDDSATVRMAIAVTLRHLKDSRIKQFLKDKEPRIVNEAVFAVNDLQMHDATADLAAMLPALPAATNKVGSLIHARVINANYYLGTKDAAERIMKYATREDLAERERREALATIEGWSEPHILDPHTGLPRPEPEDRDDIKEVVQKHIVTVISKSTGYTMAHATQLATKFGVDLSRNTLLKQLADSEAIDEIRIAALNSLLDSGIEDPIGLLHRVLKFNSHAVRLEALNHLLKRDETKGLDAAINMALRGDVPDQQAALAILSAYGENEDVWEFFRKMLSKLAKGQIAADIQLDLLNAGLDSEQADLRNMAESHVATLANESKAGVFALALQGGNVERGQKLFETHGGAQCLRCHIVHRKGAQVGPNLSRIAERVDRAYLLESIVDPGANIAEGFGMISLTLKDGTILGGIIGTEDDTTLELRDLEGNVTEVAVKEIKERSQPVTGMPPMTAILKPAEVRDIVAYLATLKRAGRKPPPPKGGHK